VTPVPDPPAVDLEDLVKDYPGTRAVCGIRLEILEGEFFGLLGPNGAGKTTTIHMLTGLIEPTSGQVRIQGLPMASRPLEAKARLGFVPQEFAFYPSLNAVDNLRFFGRLYGLRGERLERRIRRVLEVASLTGRSRRAVSTFSGGMMRRLNVAVGLVHEPRILVLDEPTAGVDAQSRAALYETLERLNREGVTLLYTTHQMEEAQRLCRRVAIMDRGRILHVDTPERLIRRFGEGLVRVELKTSLPSSAQERMGRLEGVEGADGRGRFWHLKTREPERAVRALLALEEIREAGVLSLNVLEPNLESVFIRLTGRRLRDPAEKEEGPVSEAVP
jgi:ABC-2 type transport system ATP-binding protein